MAKTNEAITEINGREMMITRVLNAPRDLVWDVWTKPEHIKNWWGPNGFTNTIEIMDVKPEGVWKFVMHGPDGADFNNKSIYKEVVKPERIVFEHESAPKFRTTVTFEAQGDKTLLTWRMLFENEAQLEQVVKTFKADVGLRQNIEKLEVYLASDKKPDKEICITRIFDAPREMVFKAWIEPEQLVRWYAPVGATIKYPKLEPMAGGKFHSCISSDVYGDCWCIGTYLEVSFPHRIIFTIARADEHGNLLTPEEAGMNEGWPIETIVKVTLVEKNGKTELTLEQSVSEEVAKIRGAYQSWLEMLDALALHLKK